MLHHFSAFRRPTLSVFAAFAIIALPLAASPAEPYVINAILPLTGSGAFLGKEEAASLGVVESLVNKDGGVGGRPIHFNVADDQSSAPVAVQLMNGVVAAKAPVVIGSTLVAMCSAMEPLAKDGPVIYCLSPGVHPAAGSWMFSSGISTTDLLAASAHYFRERGLRRVAIITSTDATGQDAERSVNEAFAGDTIVAREHFNPTDISVSAQMAHIRASNAQVLIAWTSGTPLGTLLRGAVESGLDIPILTSSSNLTYAQMQQYQGFLPKELYFPGSPGFAPNELPAGPLKAAVGRAAAAFAAAGMKPDEGQFLSWDPALIVVAALKKYGPNATAAQVKDYIANLTGMVGVLGDHDFKAVPQRGVGVGSVIMLRWDTAKGTWVGVSKPGGTPL